MGRKQDTVSLLCKGRDHLHDSNLVAVVKVCCRLVHQQVVCILCQCPRNQCKLAFPSGNFRRCCGRSDGKSPSVQLLCALPLSALCRDWKKGCGNQLFPSAPFQRRYIQTPVCCTAEYKRSFLQALSYLRCCRFLFPRKIFPE